MLKSPENLGIIHFIGIGGIGMSGIAEILVQSGYIVQGSDLNESKNTTRLKKLGVTIFIGQKKANIKIIDYRMIGANGRLYLSGREAEIRNAREAAELALRKQ